MAEYHYVACHDCRVVGMLPKTSAPAMWHDEWVAQFGHKDHDTAWASEYDMEFHARTQGDRITGYHEWHYEPIVVKVSEPYQDITKETMNL